MTRVVAVASRGMNRGAKPCDLSEPIFREPMAIEENIQSRYRCVRNDIQYREF
ncbi:MAG: hypothetical protein AB4426_18980 [Xenococcaceae cyanobacterium]